MRALKNNQIDIDYLSKLITEKTKVRAKVIMFYFENDKPSSIKECVYFGKITYIDLISGYCDWLSSGIKMPCVNINCITILKS